MSLRDVFLTSRQPIKTRSDLLAVTYPTLANAAQIELLALCRYVGEIHTNMLSNVVKQGALSLIETRLVKAQKLEVLVQSSLLELLPMYTCIRFDLEERIGDSRVIGTPVELVAEGAAVRLFEFDLSESVTYSLCFVVLQ